MRLGSWSGSERDSAARANGKVRNSDLAEQADSPSIMLVPDSGGRPQSRRKGEISSVLADPFRCHWVE